MDTTPHPSKSNVSYWLPMNGHPLVLVLHRESTNSDSTLSNSLPHHLYIRLNRRSASLLATCHSTQICRRRDYEGNQLVRRRSHVELRRERLSFRLKSIERSRNEKFAREEKVSQQKRAQLEMKHAKATGLRAHRVEERIRMCSHAVEKAKIMRLMKRERDGRMQKQVRERLENKLTKAAVRRQLSNDLKKLQSNSENGIPWKFRDQDNRHKITAILRIQRWWRQRKIFMLLQAYRSYYWSEETWKTTSFEDLTRRLLDKNLLLIMEQLLKRIILCTNATRPSKNTHKIFLTSWMIVYQEEAVFQERGFFERDLKLAAKDMISSWEHFLQDYSKNTAYELAWKFSEVFEHFLRRFNEWKFPDAVKLTNKLIAHYLELDGICKIVDAHKEASDNWNPEIEAQKKRLREELLRLNGPSIIQVLNSKLEESRPSVMKEISLNIGFRRAIEKEASIGSSVVFNESESLKRHVFRQLWHEKIMDPEGLKGFEERWNENPERQMTKMNKNIFWTRARDHMKAGDFSDLPQIISDLKASLSLIVVDSQMEFYKSMIGHLDILMIQNQLEKKVFEVKEWLWPIFRGMRQLCAPIRDQEIAALEYITDPMDLLQELFGILDNMREDYLLLMFREPRLFESSLIAYEKASFRERVDSPEFSPMIDRTHQWLQPGEMISRFSQVRELVYKALLSLVTSTDSPDWVPETLSLDRDFLFRIQNSIQEISTIAVLLILIRSIVPQFNTHEILKQQILLVSSKETSRLVDIQSAVIDHVKAHYNISLSQQDFLCSLIDKMLHKDQTILKVLLNRTGEALFHFLQQRHWNTDALMRFNLTHVQSELENLAKRLVHFFRIHLAIYESFYQKCLKFSPKTM